MIEWYHESRCCNIAWQQSQILPTVRGCGKVVDPVVAGNWLTTWQWKTDYRNILLPNYKFQQLEFLELHAYFLKSIISTNWNLVNRHEWDFRSGRIGEIMQHSTPFPRPLKRNICLTLVLPRGVVTTPLRFVSGRTKTQKKVTPGM